MSSSIKLWNLYIINVMTNELIAKYTQFDSLSDATEMMHKFVQDYYKDPSEVTHIQPIIFCEVFEQEDF